MAEFVKVAACSELPPGTAKAVESGGKTIALYNVDGNVFATTNTCPHRGGPLGEGELASEVITCPWHGFQYNVKTGACLNKDGITVACYNVKVEGGDVKIALP